MNRKEPVAINAMLIDPFDPRHKVAVRGFISRKVARDAHDLPADPLCILAENICELTVPLGLANRALESSGVACINKECSHRLFSIIARASAKGE